MKEFITIEENITTELVEKKSKFITNLYYIENVEDAEKIIKNIKKKYHDARHNCMAYRIMKENLVVEKSSDDGEPSGTAGAPMLNILQKNNLLNVLVIVTRYFGGILLGTGGLVRAYSNSVLKAVEESKQVKKAVGMQLEVGLNYGEFENFKYYCKTNKISIKDSKYKENIVCKIELEEDIKQKIMQDYETKKININYIKELSKKFVTKNE